MLVVEAQPSGERQLGQQAQCALVVEGDPPFGLLEGVGIHHAAPLGIDVAEVRHTARGLRVGTR